MSKRRLSGVFICLGILVFVNVAVWAQASYDGVVKLNGGRSELLVRAPSQPFTPAVRASSNLVTIYSTLGKGNHVYSQLSGFGVLGTDTGQILPEMVANGFRPTADHVVTEVQVGATHLQGTNVLVVSLNEDNFGVPGKALHTWHFSNLPVVWSCCTLQTGKYAKGIKVKKGKLYWVVLRPEQKFQDTWDIFADNYAGKQGRMWANNTGTGWNASYQTLGAVGVFGK
jgi:hypothetical protein